MSDLKHAPWHLGEPVLHHVGVFRDVDLLRTDARHGFATGPARARWRLRRDRGSIASFEVGHLTAV